MVNHSKAVKTPWPQGSEGGKSRGGVQIGNRLSEFTLSGAVAGTVTRRPAPFPGGYQRGITRADTRYSHPGKRREISGKTPQISPALPSYIQTNWLSCSPVNHPVSIRPSRDMCQSSSTAGFSQVREEKVDDVGLMLAHRQRRWAGIKPTSTIGISLTCFG